MHLIILFVCTAFTINGIYSSTYIGCFKEKSTSDRLLKGDHEVFHNALTPNKCISHCAGKGFAYAGLEYSFECFCSDERPSPKSAANELDCDMECAGNSEEICGGGLRLSVYSISARRKAKYLGCYIDRSKKTGGRIMPDEMKNFENSLTPAECIEYCTEKEYDYAGLQYSSECYCSNSRPSFKWLANEADCHYKCAGDKNEICGGAYRLSVYETSEKHVNFVRRNYLGCYLDNGENRLLNGRHETFTRLTPELCAGFCYRNGYRYAGVRNGNQCFCGDNVKQENKILDFECDIGCANNNRLNCGGLCTSGIYHTQISDYSEDGKLIGCFKDKEERILPAIQMILSDTCTPKLCFNICLQLGYKYAGVESKDECYCDNTRPHNDLKVAENECEKPCAGDSTKNCGNDWRILVYSTNV